MAESRQEVIMATLQDQFETIVSDGGTTYWYTPTKVARVPDPNQVTFDESHQTVYLMCPEQAPELPANSCRMGVEMSFDLILAHRYQGQGNVWADGEARAIIQNRLTQDARNVLVSIDTLNILQAAGCDVSEVLPQQADASASTTFVDGWAIALLGVLVRYRYRAGAFGVAS